ncbi:hypothetical protein ACWQ06_16710 [Streptomyces angustmyceticus]
MAVRVRRRPRTRRHLLDRAPELEREYVTATGDDGEPRFLPVVSERARAKLNRIAAKMTRRPKHRARPLAQLRAWWKASAILTSGVAADAINSLLEHARAATAAIRARVATVVDIALAAVNVAATVFVMNGGGRCRASGLGERIVDAALATYFVDVGEPNTLRGRMPAYHLYTARWPLADLEPDRRPPTAAPDPEPGDWEIPRVPLRYERAVLAGAAVREKLRTTIAARGWAYDVVAHQQAAMPEQLLAPAAAEPEHGDQEPEAEPREAVDLTALRALRKSRTDLEALDLTAERLRFLQDVFTRAAHDPHARADRYAEQHDADGARPVRQDDQQAHRPQQPAPRRGRDAGH